MNLLKLYFVHELNGNKFYFIFSFKNSLILASGFGAPAAFGGSASFGSPPAFGSPPGFGGSPFGGVAGGMGSSAGGAIFGSAAPQTATQGNGGFSR